MDKSVRSELSMVSTRSEQKSNCSACHTRCRLPIPESIATATTTKPPSFGLDED